MSSTIEEASSHAAADAEQQASAAAAPSTGSAAVSAAEEDEQDSAADQERDDPAPEPLPVVSWRLVGLGGVIIAVLHTVIVLVSPALFRSQPALAIVLGGLPYLAGGLLVGVRARENGMLAAFYAAVIPALLLPFVAELQRVIATEPAQVAETMAAMRWLMVVAPTLGFVLTALCGCWLGELVRRRGDAKL